jgi:hypothetical protein
VTANQPQGRASDDVAEALKRFIPGDEPIATELRTSERVLARVTDGIYRRPGSALRELISNAYDADATRVVINTDRPRFERITISDNGLGMTPDVLKHLIHNIGGSAKRSTIGQRLGVTDSDDADLSPGGRTLIGKIGIGLFSVAQLTQSFQISTKVRGENFSCVASVLLRQYSDATAEVDAEGKYHAGKVLLWREPAEDVNSQGTTITLTSVRPQTREVLQSREIWDKIAAARDGNGKAMQPPMFHIGVVDNNAEGSAVLQLLPALPWKQHAEPSQVFQSLANAPKSAIENRRTPKYAELFDEYLQMLWRLGLAAPLPYVERHPFDLTGKDYVSFFRATGVARQEAEEIELGDTELLRAAVNFAAPVNPVGFEVLVDEIALKRPISLQKQPRTNAALQRPVMLVGHYRSEFPKRSIEFSGGPLEFSAYLFWTPKLVPGDHRGVLIRVNEASGTLFDRDFLGFPVNEQLRLPQITCEIFIHEGFDGALNIDRESFNHSHPHVVTLTRWFHASLRQLINTQKRLGSKAAASKRQETQKKTSGRVQAVVNKVWSARQEGASPPAVVFTTRHNTRTPDTDADAISLPTSFIGSITGKNADARRHQREEILEAITQVLAAYEFFEDLSEEEALELVQNLYNVASVHLS